MRRHAELSLPATTDAPDQARGFVRARCGEWGLTEVADDLAIVVSELVTNAVVHARSPSTVTMSVTADAVELSVRDRAAREPTLRPARHDLIADLDAAVHLPNSHDSADTDPRHESLVVGDAGSIVAGRGLLIIDALASRWGTTKLTDGKAVWAKLTVPPAANASV